MLSAPLPTVVQERLDREAAYEKTKEEGQKWSGVMKRVKEAEHLAFPLQASERGGVKGAGEVIATFKPANAHESAVEALLAQANLTDKGVKAAEDAALKGQDLSVEEIAARRAELRHQRELMFRAESRAKRVAKIKSKTFRKLARKREAREAEKGEISLEDLERLDPEAAAEERERLERDRARERATLRHGAKTSRWARDMDAVEADEDQRMAKLEMLDMKERLQRKIHAVGSDDDSDESSEDDSDADEEAIKTRAFDQLAKLDAKTAPEPTKGIAGMAFMKKAAEREMKKVREAEAALRAELDGDEEAGSEDEDAPSMMKVGEGRMVFSGPAGSAAASTSSAPAKPTAAPAPERSPSPEPVLFGAANPWLADGAGSGPSRKRNTVSNSAEAKVVRTLKKAGKDRAAAADDEVVEISLDVKAKPAAAAAKKEEPKLKSILKKPAKKEEPKEAKDGSDSDSDDDNDELLPISGVKAFSQRELVAEAFAGDNVVEVSNYVQRETNASRTLQQRRHALRRSMRPRSRTPRWRAGAVGPARASRSASPTRTPASSRRRQVLLPRTARTRTAPTSSSPRSATRRQQSTSPRTCRIRTPVWRSTRRALPTLSAASGTRAQDTSARPSRASSRR